MKNNIYQDISLNDLEVNPDNARHTPQADEKASINWLVSNLTERMKKLSIDILNNKTVYDPPLVRKEKNKWRVHDGNRRVACLKILNDPSLIEDPQIQAAYQNLIKNYSHTLPKEINCRIENDLQLINDILERRHAGGETGIGQMPWGPEEKDNFFRQRGIDNPKPKFGNELNHFLKNSGVISSDDKIPVSIFDRLLSNEDYRNKVGLTFKGKKVQFVADRDASISVLKQIIEDTKTGVLNLNKAWSTKDKNNYFIELAKKGVALNLPQKTAVKINPSETAQKKPNKVSGLRHNLVPPHVEFPSAAISTIPRAQNIFIELKNNLNFSYHGNAIAVLFRVFIELCVDYYLETQQINVSSKNKFGPSLGERFSACLDRMVENSLIDDKDRKVLVKFKEPDRFLSIDTFNGYIHHRLANPIQSELISKWDTLQKFLMHCLDEKPIQK